LALGWQFEIVNNSTGALTVNSSGSNLVATIPPGNSLNTLCILTSGTTAASWTARFDASNAAPRVEFGVACSDETTAVVAGTNRVRFRMPFAMTVTGVRATCSTAPTGSTLIVDINEAGASILSTKLSIDATENSSVTAATPPVISDAALADNAEISVDFDQVGATVAGTGVKIWILGTRA
jgi:hypothetical protein